MGCNLLLQFAHDPVELAQVAASVQAERGLLRRELGGDGLARDIPGPQVVGSVEPGRRGLAAAAGIPAARHAPGDRAPQHQAKVCRQPFPAAVSGEPVQPTLFDLPRASAPAPRSVRADPRRGVRLQKADRFQMAWGPNSLDAQLPEDHPARAIDAVIERLDLSALYGQVEALEGEAGPPAMDSKILLNWWVYATSEGGRGWGVRAPVVRDRTGRWESGPPWSGSDRSVGVRAPGSGSDRSVGVPGLPWSGIGPVGGSPGPRGPRSDRLRRSQAYLVWDRNARRENRRSERPLSREPGLGSQRETSPSIRSRRKRARRGARANPRSRTPADRPMTRQEKLIRNMILS